MRGWLACWTQEEIAKEVGCSKGEVNAICSEMADLPKLNKPAVDHTVDFEVPLYNIWRQQEKTPGSRESRARADSPAPLGMGAPQCPMIQAVCIPGAGGSCLLGHCRRSESGTGHSRASTRQARQEWEALIKRGHVVLPRFSCPDLDLVFLSPPSLVSLQLP